MNNKKIELIKKIVVWLVIVIMLLGSLATVFVYAADFTTSASAPSEIGKGESFTVTFSFSSSELVSGIEGNLVYDKSKLSISSSSGAGSFTAMVGERIVAYPSDFTSSGSTSGSFAKVTFTANSSFLEGESTTISLSNVSGSATSEDDVYDISGSGCSVSVSIPKSEPSYTPPKPDDTPSVKPENNKNNGDNTTETEKKSSDNSLSKLEVNNAQLSPAFSSDVTEYSLNVKYEIQKLDITAIANDANAKVEIKNNELVEDSSNKVEIVVTAQNGDVKTYVIKAYREKNPNYVASSNCNLTEIKLSYGTLSPLFDKDVLNYVVSVPYDLESITFDATPESPNATCNVIGESKLKAGEENSYHIICTAEDGKTSKIYNVTVISTHSYETFISKYFIDSVVNQIKNNVNPIVLDLSGADVQILSKDIFAELKEKENTVMIVRTKNGTITFNSDDLIYDITDKYYDLTIIKSSLYSDNMLPSLASYENFVFSTHHKSELPGFATFSIFTEFVKGTKVNIYMYDRKDNSYVIAAKNVEVGDGGVVAFEIDKGGDFIITTKDITSAGEYHSVNRESNMETYAKTLLYIIGALVCLSVGFALGFILNRSGKHAKRVRVSKGKLQNGKARVKENKTNEKDMSESVVLQNKPNEEVSENTKNENDSEFEAENINNDEIVSEYAKTELPDLKEDMHPNENISNVFSVENETEDDITPTEETKEKKGLFKRKKSKSLNSDEDDVSEFEAMLDELNKKK